MRRGINFLSKSECKYLMTVINGFIKFANALPLKTGKEVTKGLQPFLVANKMEYPQTENEKENYNSVANALKLNKYGVKHYLTHSEENVSIVGRMYCGFCEEGFINAGWICYPNLLTCAIPCIESGYEAT